MPFARAKDGVGCRVCARAGELRGPDRRREWEPAADGWHFTLRALKKLLREAVPTQIKRQALARSSFQRLGKEELGSSAGAASELAGKPGQRNVLRAEGEENCF